MNTLKIANGLSFIVFTKYIKKLIFNENLPKILYRGKGI